jgi:hypothetical protein
MSSLLTWIAVYLARWRRLCIWLNSSIHRSRARNEFPPLITGANRANRLVATAILMILVAGFIGLFVVLVAVGAFIPNLANQNGLSEIMGAVVGCGLPVGFACVILIFRDVAGVVLSAKTPEMCWQPRDPIAV